MSSGMIQTIDRHILEQQRDHFLPLKVIKSKLTLWERGEETSERSPEVTTQLDQPGEPLDQAALLKRSGLSLEELAALAEVGLIKPLRDSTVYPPEAGIIGAEAKRLMDQGLEPRHLRVLRLSADRESDLLTQLVAPLLKATNPESKARAREVLEECSGSVRAMHRALLSVELKQHVDV